MESSTHRRLKSLAVEWLFDIGCRAVAIEVACPIGRYRVDVAGWLDDAHDQGDEGDEGDEDLPRPDAAWRVPAEQSADGATGRRSMLGLGLGPGQSMPVHDSGKDSGRDWTDDAGEAWLGNARSRVLESHSRSMPVHESDGSGAGVESMPVQESALRGLDARSMPVQNLVHDSGGSGAGGESMPVQHSQHSPPGLFDAMPLVSEPPSRRAAATRRPPRRSRRRGPRSPRVIVIECKQSRADFFRNHTGRDAVLAERDRLQRLARRIEERRIKRHEPHLRRVEAGLFEDRESWDFESTSIGAYHRVRERLARVEQDLYGRSKFDLLARYRLADHLLVLSPRGLVRPREIPACWGLLECSRRQRLGRPDPGEVLRTRRRSERLRPDEARRQRFLRNIAAAASRAALRAGAYGS